ncbi:phosphoserine phosphatase SerB [Rothia kristinae]|nr:phosphoserine phosphatase SerB [Rothia kristinae]
MNLEVPDLGVERVQSVLDALDPQARWQVMAVPALPEGTPRLVVTDVDSTLIGQEVIDDLAARAGARERIAAITERAMRGELDFAASLRERVAALAGLPVSVLEAVREGLVLNPGARELVARLHARGDRIGAVSGGFAAILDPLAAHLGLDRALANGLEIADDGFGPRLTGRVRGPVVDAAAKRRALSTWAQDFDLAAGATVAMGDGANDLLMVEAAGLGVAYCAKPALDAAAAARIPVPRLDALLALLD